MIVWEKRSGKEGVGDDRAGIVDERKNDDEDEEEDEDEDDVDENDDDDEGEEEWRDGACIEEGKEELDEEGGAQL